jgi:alkanesulfonate monooxygenase SsuD/methylene tetrahydromethanopterin reductase-like flavin-dependent oxidoreductase (luciferase family)
MELGVCVAAKVDDVDHIVLAEQLGYASAWVADSHLIWSDPYATLALAATRTERLRLGTGVAVAGLRPEPVTAAGIATVNRLAPGRTFLGIGSGNTAMRIMGHPPLRIAEMDAYLSTLRPLLRGEEAELTWHGRTTRVRHAMPDAGFVDLDHEIPVHVSGFGPRSLGLAGKHGDGVVISGNPTPSVLARIWSAVEAGAAAVGRTIDRRSFTMTCLTTVVVLEPGEAIDSPRARSLCDAFAIATLHYAYDQWRNFGKAPTQPAVLDVWDDYVALLEQVPEDVRHQVVHRGHNCWVVPEEERFVTRELIEASCMVATRDELLGRLHELDQAGLDEMLLLPPLATRDQALREAAELIPQLR